MQQVKEKLKNIPGLIWGVLVIILVFIFFAKGFTKYQNILNILSNTAILLIISCGMTMAILSKEIDISIGGVMSFAGLGGALFITRFENPGIPAIILTFAIGTGIGLCFGLFNGVLIGKYKYNYWLITFATMSIGYGAAQVINGGNVVSGFPKAFRNVADSKFLGIPTVVWVALVIVLIMLFITYKTRFGMHIYAVGDSEQCASQSGINVKKTRILIYMLAGMLSGFGGVLLVAKTNSAGPVAASGYEWNAIAATIIGGTSFEGGKGGLAGTIIGALVMSMIINGLQLMGFSNYWQQVYKGAFILLIIVVDVISRRKKKKAALRRVYKYDEC
ncbi:ABC transporter permease [Diplocloster agilis]|uniref:ABC transporter permease n=1 Tax=Diplocloster agilis TaxID=2850323 RepID=UPI00082319D4|nr:ABC transporter permease [Suonthocola fibrivorans]MCU6735710.1 ABC transporter permease [Suonthocola fibrivorans]SCJ80206.1 Ribose transport system permease protein rbsC [uncultured Clostridium sp.]